MVFLENRCKRKRFAVEQKLCIFGKYVIFENSDDNKESFAVAMKQEVSLESEK